MECNKEEARRAMDLAKMKVTENDYDGAKKFVYKAQNLYPELDGLKQVLMMVNVYISASNGGEADWYGVLGVDPLADDVAVKKQYKKLALLLHPDKNKFNGAEGAFKLVSEAWSLLSDKVKRIAYDQKRKSKVVKPRKSRKQQKQPPNQQKQRPNQRKQQQPPNQQQQQPPNQSQQQPNQQQQQPSPQKQPPKKQPQPPNQQKQQPSPQKQPPKRQPQPPNQQQQQLSPQKQPPKKQPQPPNQQQQQPSPKKQQSNQPSSNGFGNGKGRSNKRSSDSSKQKKVDTFWTMCNKCCSEYEYFRGFYLNKKLLCRNCNVKFVAIEKEKTTPTEDANGVASSCWRDSSVADSVGEKDCSISRMDNSNCGNVANQGQERVKRGVEERDEDDATRGIADAARGFKKLRTDDFAGASCGIKV